jgi:DNA-binding beta-propeller fold protein YncE
MVMWAPVPGAASYNIYLNDTPVGKAVAAPPFQFPTPEAGGEYKIEVSAVGADGSESGRSAPGRIAIVKLLPQKELGFLLGDKAVMLRWTNQVGTVITDIYRAEKKDGEYKLLMSVQDTRYADTKVETGKVYFYKLKAKDVSGKESEFSAPLVVSLVTQMAVKENKAVLALKKAKVEMVTADPPFTWNDSFLLGGELYILERDKEAIRVYDLETGKQTKVIGSRGYLPGQVVYPSGLGRLANGNFAVCDYARNVVMILNPAGELVKEWPFPSPKEMALEKEAKPGKLAVSPDDKIFVADGNNYIIHVFDANGALLKTFGGAKSAKNTGPEFFTGIGGMVFASDGTLYISDFRSGEVHVVDKDLKHKMIIGVQSGVGTIVQPGKVLIDEAKKEVLVPDELLATVQAFDTTTGNYKYTLTNEQGEMDPSKTRGKWEVGNPAALHRTADGSIVVINKILRTYQKVKVLE